MAQTILLRMCKKILSNLRNLFKNMGNMKVKNLEPHNNKIQWEHPIMQVIIKHKILLIVRKIH